MSPAPSAASVLGLAIGALMAVLGVTIALRLLALGRDPLTGTAGLDYAFSAFFILRGALQYRRWRLARERAEPF
ncbi:MAG: hypothetical protein IT361_12980 [Gemmatimonadaceae bacterium]|nr:hypothetical protein [Gemmatimonadaceae bacterium]